MTSVAATSAAAEEAASDRNRGAAARCFQRAALHLEILRLLGGRPLTAPLETSRRYARWRARRALGRGGGAARVWAGERRRACSYIS